MNDRELLEKAAQAAGIDAKVDSELGLGDEGLWLKGERSPDNSKYWNPLTDDGDALRLAVKLDIDVCRIGDFTRAAYCVGCGLFSVDEHDSDHSDPYAATRRAIVRAAAAMK